MLALVLYPFLAVCVNSSAFLELQWAPSNVLDLFCPHPDLSLNPLTDLAALSWIALRAQATVSLPLGQTAPTMQARVGLAGIIFCYRGRTKRKHVLQPDSNLNFPYEHQGSMFASYESPTHVWASLMKHEQKSSNFQTENEEEPERMTFNKVRD